jgi:hypothetical protein
LLVDLQNNTCGIAFSVVVDSNQFKSQNDTLILGKSFLALYKVSLDFSHQRIGLEGFVSDPFVFSQQFVTKEPLQIKWVIIWIMIAAVILLAIVYLVIRIREKRLKNERHLQLRVPLEEEEHKQ